MSRKPHKNIRPNDNQKAVYQCKECGKTWLDEPKGVNAKQFCSEECKKHYEAKSKPDIDESPLDGKKSMLQGDT